MEELFRCLRWRRSTVVVPTHMSLRPVLAGDGHEWWCFHCSGKVPSISWESICLSNHASWSIFSLERVWVSRCPRIGKSLGWSRALPLPQPIEQEVPKSLQSEPFEEALFAHLSPLLSKRWLARRRLCGLLSRQNRPLVSSGPLTKDRVLAQS